MSWNRAPQTIAAANGIGTDGAFGAVTPPLYLSSTYTFEGFDRARAYDYTHAGNPTREVLADTLAQLEAGAKVVVDNTFPSPALQQPIRLGADLVVHSTGMICRFTAMSA